MDITSARTLVNRVLDITAERKAHVSVNREALVCLVAEHEKLSDIVYRLRCVLGQVQFAMLDLNDILSNVDNRDS